MNFWMAIALISVPGNILIVVLFLRRLRYERQMRQPPRFRPAHPDAVIEPDAAEHAARPKRRARVTKAVMTQRRVD